MTEAEKQKLYAHPAWESCTFEGAELSTLRLGLETTFREKLEWLEAAEDLFLRFQAGQKWSAPTQLEALNDAPPKSDEGGRAENRNLKTES